MDVHIYGELDEDLLNRQITIGQSKEGARTRPGNWHNSVGTFGALIASLSEFEIGKKDGRCILQGEAIGGHRKSKSMRSMEILMLDHDTGVPFDTLCEQAENSGLFTLLWTTHSHMKAESRIILDQLLKHSKVIKQEIETEHAIAYLREVKGYEDNVLEDAELLKIEQTERGIEAVIHHQPMEKARSLRILKEPFVFGDRDSGHNEAIKEWRSTIYNVAASLGAKFDTSCVDPARLMYTPRVKKKTDNDRIVIFAGDPLDLDSIEPAEVSYEEKFIQEDKTGSDTLFKTRALKRFLGRHSKDFNMADFLEDMDPDSLIENRQEGGIHFVCPNSENHTEQIENDPAFMAVNPDDNDDPDMGFSALCLHQTCKDMSGGDRAWYLDQACQNYGIKHADELEKWCTDVEYKGNEIQDKIESLKENDDQAIEDIINDISCLDNKITVERYLSTLTDKSKIGRIALKGAIKDARRENNKARKEPRKPDEYSGIVMQNWDFDVKTRVVLSTLKLKNARKPTLFSREEGGSVRMSRKKIDGDYKIKVQQIKENAMMNEISKLIDFGKANEDGSIQKIEPFSEVISWLEGEMDLPLPQLDRVVKVPIFTNDGSLQQKNGYSKKTRCFLECPFDPYPVRGQPTEKDMDTAIELIYEDAIRDYPFTDKFGGRDKFAIKDDDGNPIWGRGRSSRANTLAMILQPFCRNMIEGPTPIYHIDKSSPGTGASFLVDTPYIITEGHRAIAKTISTSNEEFRKSITASLRTGSSIMFLDNINHHIDSGDLAAALTTGTWRDRILGTSDEVEIPIRAMWIMAGNNLSFSDELMRRIVPIRMDAEVPNPSMDRPSSTFKHFPPQPWLMENRAKLVWACHTIIQNWIADGMPMCYDQVMYSFDSWAAVMGGILKSAGIAGFLENRKSYLDSNNTDNMVGMEFSEAFWETFKTEKQPTKNIIDMFWVEGSGWEVDIPVDGSRPENRVRRLGIFMAKHMLGKVAKINANDKEITVKWVKEIKGGNLAYWGLEVLD